ncbi:MAG: hypothetical protein COW54_01585 [Rhodobacteraceae bacterium CG17_big_fil_post_rev_8_21_14_2_50_63_15]|nr:MAG: hypothetical protein COW54_01585 [Rhodobacteraceae bacterium CG17_big_fil_post_rev_8_21_14_2_50_63_15]
MPRLVALLLCLIQTFPVGALETSVGRLAVTKMAGGLEEPWALGFLPDGGVLITERGGRLLLLEQGRLDPVHGLPEVAVIGQGGLLDVLVPRDFAATGTIYLTFAKWQSGRPNGTGTAVARARLDPRGRQLTDWTEIFELTPGSAGGVHFGSRLVEGPDGTLFVTIGERGEADAAQDLGRENGSVIRIARDGGIPEDNPFLATPGARPAIWSYGHRNPQGAALDAAGALWVVEHGAKGGDEVNLIRRGANYGWPVISYGTHYSGKPIGEGAHKPGMEQPAFYWDPSIAPSGMMIYSGRLWPEWQGDIFVGSLKFDLISRLSGMPLAEAERLHAPETDRVRDIREAPDGSIWFLSVGNGAAYRITPE